VRAGRTPPEPAAFACVLSATVNQQRGDVAETEGRNDRHEAIDIVGWSPRLGADSRRSPPNNVARPLLRFVRRSVGIRIADPFAQRLRRLLRHPCLRPGRRCNRLLRLLFRMLPGGPRRRIILKSLANRLGSDPARIRLLIVHGPLHQARSSGDDETCLKPREFPGEARSPPFFHSKPCPVPANADGISMRRPSCQPSSASVCSSGCPAHQRSRA
jgi:hypothetical protein